MKKLPNQYDDYFDNFLSYLSGLLSPTFKKLKFTPNLITTLSLITGLIALVLLYKFSIIGFIIFFIASYFFDVMDGYYARKYKMITKFGDYYDHIKDIIVFILFTVILIFKYKVFNNPEVILIYIILFIGVFFQYSCQEKYYARKKNMNIAFGKIKKLCFSKPEKIMRVSRYLSSGTLIIYSCIVVIYLKYTQSL